MFDVGYHKRKASLLWGITSTHFLKPTSHPRKGCHSGRNSKLCEFTRVLVWCGTFLDRLRSRTFHSTWPARRKITYESREVRAARCSDWTHRLGFMKAPSPRTVLARCEEVQVTRYSRSSGASMPCWAGEVPCSATSSSFDTAVFRFYLCFLFTRLSCA